MDVATAEPDEAEVLVTAVIQRGGDVRVCATCSPDRESDTVDLVQGAALSSPSELSRWISAAERLLVF